MSTRLNNLLHWFGAGSKGRGVSMILLLFGSFMMLIFGIKYTMADELQPHHLTYLGHDSMAAFGNWAEDKDAHNVLNLLVHTQDLVGTYLIVIGLLLVILAVVWAQTRSGIALLGIAVGSFMAIVGTGQMMHLIDGPIWKLLIVGFPIAGALINEAFAMFFGWRK